MTAVMAPSRASADFGIIGTTLQIVGESLCEAVNLRAGSRVLDVAGGAGTCALAAARRWCDVTCTDHARARLDEGRRRAEVERLPIGFHEAGVDALPFADGSFDTVLSSFGVMFAPDHAAAAGELLRVCRPDGRIGLANWTARGFVGQLYALVRRYVPPALRSAAPLDWGLDAHIRQLFGDEASEIRTTTRQFVFRYRSAEHWIQVFRSGYGPLHRAFMGLGPEAQICLERNLIYVIEEFNQSRDSTVVIPEEYSEVVIVRR